MSRRLSKRLNTVHEDLGRFADNLRLYIGHHRTTNDDYTFDDVSTGCVRVLEIYGSTPTNIISVRQMKKRFRAQNVLQKPMTITVDQVKQCVEEGTLLDQLPKIW